MIKLLLLIPMLLFSFSLTACQQEKEIDIEALSLDLFQNAGFTDELTLVNADTAAKLYQTDQVVNQYVYISSGATAEEIAIFEFETKEAALAALPTAQERIAEQKSSYESYMPKEVHKLENAIVKQTGRYLIVCVADGKYAQEIIHKYL